MPNLLTRIEGGFDTGALTAAAVPAYARVSLQSSGFYQVATNAEVGDGVLDHDGFASQTDCRIHLSNCPGSKFGIASGAIATGAILYAAANGAVSASGTVVVGKARYATVDTGVAEYFSRSTI